MKDVVQINGPNPGEVIVYIYDSSGFIYERRIEKRNAISYVKAVQEHGYWYTTGNKIDIIHPRDILKVEIFDMLGYLTKTVGTHSDSFFGRIGERV